MPVCLGDKLGDLLINISRNNELKCVNQVGNILLYHGFILYFIK